MRTARFHRVFAAAHRIWNDESKCSNIHGHNFTADVEIAVPDDAGMTPQGFVVPFDVVKGVIDTYDHVLILDVADPLAAIERARFFTDSGCRLERVAFAPSTENMASYFARRIASETFHANPGAEGGIVTVELRETEGIAAVGEATIQA